MPSKLLVVALLLLSVCAPLAAQNAFTWSYRVELRGDYRHSDDEQFVVGFLPFKGLGVAMQTPDPGSHVELNVASLQLDFGYGNWFAARALVHGQALDRRNPTGTDRQTDADELWLRFGVKPEILERPSGTSFFLQAGKFPKMERQPVRLLESYGLAATSFNRFEDVQVMGGGSVGRNFYWRLAGANGNPLFFRDFNALAGDNGTTRVIPPVRKFNTGFPMLYNAEAEGLFFKTDHVQFGQGLGYRWQREDETMGVDAIVFHYRRKLADREELTGTFYGGDLDLLDTVDLPDTTNIRDPLPIHGNTKEEYGSRIYGEWRNATMTAQYTHQNVAGLGREGWEVETGYRIPLRLGFVESIQPAVRASSIDNHFVGDPTKYPAPSVWWDWRKYDAGVRIGLRHGLDVTAEYTTHQIKNPRLPLHRKETVVTIRWRS
jgi:hypothetical protein